ncbi:ion transporter [Telluribacter sp. SYSU D00476]|uniref:ion transporter n=1 Tax=Telluribacter sp. SYSU D00476 TaxID=2811430 RepID=UPI001FF49A8D|nr:ion transporter [Telluribacter sp. SYSU D00476]
MKNIRDKLYTIIFESDTPAGKAFDVALIISIIISVLSVMLESVASLRALYREQFFVIDWLITILFTVEYLLRVWVSRNTREYTLGVWGIIDLLAILPAFLSLFVSGTQFLLAIRILRVLRVFRILKLARYISATQTITRALGNSYQKILVFLGMVLSIVIILGTVMYLVENGNNRESAFSSIPLSIYWAIVTLTTVGFGDIVPATVPGKFIASLIMLIGYSIIAVPTGIVTNELLHLQKGTTKPCSTCGNPQNDQDAVYCKKCGSQLDA